MNPKAKCFEKYMRDTGIPYVSVDEAKQALFSGIRLSTFDFVVYRDEGPNWLVTCCCATPQLKDLMCEWQSVFGTGFAAVAVDQGCRGGWFATRIDDLGTVTWLPSNKKEDRLPLLEAMRG